MKTKKTKGTAAKTKPAKSSAGKRSTKASPTKRSSLLNKSAKKKKINAEEPEGYPYYPVVDDIMNSGEEKLEVDMENLESPIENFTIQIVEVFPEEVQVDLQPGTDADVTKEDLENLGDINLNLDMGDDEDLRHRIFPVDMEGKDLVVPGADADDAMENIGEEDEENNLYSESDT